MAPGPGSASAAGSISASRVKLEGFIVDGGWRADRRIDAVLDREGRGVRSRVHQRPAMTPCRPAPVQTQEAQARRAARSAVPARSPILVEFRATGPSRCSTPIVSSHAARLSIENQSAKSKLREGALERWI